MTNWNLITRESKEVVETVVADSMASAVAKFQEMGWSLFTRQNGPSKFIITMD